MIAMAVDFAHTSHAEGRRRTKAIHLARYLWDRGLTPADLLSLRAEQLRRLARTVGVHPPRSAETWYVTARLLEQKTRWAQAHSDHPAAARARLDERELWMPSAQPDPEAGGDLL